MLAARLLLINPAQVPWCGVAISGQIHEMAYGRGRRWTAQLFALAGQYGIGTGSRAACKAVSVTWMVRG